MILIFVASLNENMKLAKNLQEQLKSEKLESEIINLVELNLPMYDTLKEQNDGIPTKIHELSEKMNKAEGFLFISPEYNFSLPPVLVNTIAWLSRIGDDFRALFALKKIQLATHSGSGGQDALNAMRTQFTRLNAIVLPREILTTYTKALDVESSQRIISQFASIVKG
ncbi:NADPH-dependent FMN reductase [Arcobacter nitrofigilis DSM 7299]|uniref:NADPH-dependent FMN reductase n=1 Tax=Arcobacter nitrofigilis (strain ATCC 33309 / DSM 7299 / CCUG 15893 / LMG 7604 / NCTC 12251 / CI) TaxID=572480 RepID=D5V4T7_ARCNC|nr:NAD(P)H-dependent oxidoreductase [Arcobacter nitrofigilis]ADG91899.1 NADPH-dependent FMN reductase [Arcobacter nitrofigilis DSM 7299]